jgi:1,2-diacylglycerol 3-alpha-glucosyltransferase
MRICIFTDSFLPRISGVSSAVMNQANELVRRGHEVAIFRPKPPKHLRDLHVGEMDSRAQLHEVPLSIPDRRFPDLHITVPTLLPSWSVVREFQPDLIHAHTEWGCGLEGLVSSRLENVPLFGTFHTFFADPEYLRHFCMPDTWLTRKAMWKYAVGFYNRCNAVITPSMAVRERLLTHGLKSPAIVLSNGIETPIRVADEAVQARRVAEGLDPMTYIYVGRISSEKSLDVVIKAFGKVHARHPDTRLALVGSGNEEGNLKALIQDARLTDAVRWLGCIPHDVLIRDNIPRLGDVFVTASKTENQPVSILEAMALGLPMIGPDAKGMPELIRDGLNGFLFPPDDIDALTERMEVLYRDEPLRKRMGETALQHARKHDLGHVINQLEEVYLTVLHKKKLKWGRRLRDWPSLQWLLRRRKRPIAQPLP